MFKDRNAGRICILLSMLLLLPTFLVSPAWSAGKAEPSSQEEVLKPVGPPGDQGDEGAYRVVPITMEMEAGAAQYKVWPGGEQTIHAGIGWLHPFGRGEYFAGMGYPEAADYPMPSYFNEEWMATYGTRLFCIYRLSDGDIYAYDGVTGNLVPFEDSVNDGKMDYLINVIVGGTGAYEGATGMLLGRTPGKGANTEVSDGVALPVSILKLMEGYIKIPLKEENDAAAPVQ